MGIRIARVLALITCLFAVASWTHVAAQDAEQIAISAATNVRPTLLATLSTLSSRLISPFPTDPRIPQQSLLWGTYRPQLYHGIRARLPRSLMTGLMWFGLNDYKGFQGTSPTREAGLRKRRLTMDSIDRATTEIRHTCEQSDGLTSYTYTKHDGRRYAVQELVDGKNNVRLQVSFLKNQQGDGWAVRVEGDAIDPSKLSRTSLIYHLGLEGLGSLSLDNDDHPSDGLEGDINLHGSSPDLLGGGRFHVRITDHPSVVTSIRGNKHHLFPHEAEGGKTGFLGVTLPEGQVWRVKDVVSQSIGAYAQKVMVDGGFEPGDPPDPAYLFRLQNKVQGGEGGQTANVWALQKVGVGSGVSGGARWGFDVFFGNADVGDAKGWTYESLTRQLAEQSRIYDARFAETFALPSEFSSGSYTKFAQSITSNLIGGIGYFYGDSIIDRSFKQPYDEDGTDDDDDDEDAYTGPQGPTREPSRELLTATPSRSFFPRGFYWDEGFHLPIIAEWDNDLALEILKSWIGLIDENGWVAREQILGEEARSKVPQEFQTQYPSYANPPTLPMAVTGYIRRLKAAERKRAEAGQAAAVDGLLEAQLGFGQLPLGQPASSSALITAHLDSPALASSYLHSIYPALRRHYLWFRRTQRGQLREWGRRATSRVEAYRWRGRTEHHVLTSGLDDYPRAAKPHVGELHVDLMSWMGFFARTMRDVAEYLGEEDDAVEYRRHERGILANLEDLHWSEDDQAYCDVTVNDDGEPSDSPYGLRNTDSHCFRGRRVRHVNTTSPHLGAILDLISSPDHLWSEYGIRSLSASHPLFGQGEDYWRGPIWIQMNWLALKALKEKYAVEQGPYQQKAKDIYAKLRQNVVQNVHKEFERTGYVWEQYNANTGEGQRSHPFTGWTSLVTMIMTERY
ncbi:hypothetical protein QFC21_006018 [Naganishia friedmannii]|uniref:Uncharacterized protein n=1 Tax=Naganishia friedmannii TaxID=89922 RepID=A0ACC2V560_9TREE|nr:hypothetical protein QFC21_006018 [Naganishia friedmannii]